MDLGILLLVLKGIILTLIYFALIYLLIVVIRETRLHVPKQSILETSASIGSLKILETGSDDRLRTGSFLILRPETNLGTKPGNTILLRDQYVSGQHARLWWDGISWFIEDLGSTNGTYVDDKRISSGEPVPLMNGSILKIGDMVFEMIE